MRYLALFEENIKIALRSIRSNLLRTILTVLIIAFGIMSLVGILTAIESIKSSINSEFSNMGANTFTIRNKGARIHVGKRDRNSITYKSITYEEAQSFKKEFVFPANVSVSTFASRTSTIKYKSEKTNPNVAVLGVDENYITTSGRTVDQGRNFSMQEIQMNRSVVIIGSEISDNLFGKTINPIDKIISVGNNKYKVIGVLKSKGTSMGSMGDKMCIIPISNVRQYYSIPDMSFIINIMPFDGKVLEIALGEAEGLFRKIRKLNLSDKNNFEVQKSDNLASMLFDNIKYVTIAATIIGIITLLGAAIGLMNIMLVSVSERTREIGTRKAMGATQKLIKQQFLFESIVIGQLGGLLGIILGILIGNVVSVITGGAFIIPWFWIIVGVILCFLVGLASGMIPAIKASKLDPIIALRYE